MLCYDHKPPPTLSGTDQHKREYNSFPEFCDSSYGFIELEGGHGDPQQSFQVVRRSVHSNSRGESFETSHQENTKDAREMAMSRDNQVSTNLLQLAEGQTRMVWELTEDI